MGNRGELQGRNKEWKSMWVWESWRPGRNELHGWSTKVLCNQLMDDSAQEKTTDLVEAECGRQDGSPSGAGWDLLGWVDLTVILLEVHCLARTMPTSYWKGTASVRADTHSSSNASFDKCFLLYCGVRLERRGSSSVSKRTFMSLLQQDYRWHIQTHHWMHWASLQCPGADGGLVSLIGEDRWAGRGEGRGC